MEEDVMTAIWAQVADSGAIPAPDRTAEFAWMLAFGFAVILLAAVVSLLKKGASSVTFMRMAGLLSIATIAGTLVLLNVSGEALTAAFTVLGTIAGYLAGAKTATSTTVPAADGGGTTKIAESGI